MTSPTTGSADERPLPDRPARDGVPTCDRPATVPAERGDG
jgi:hypothetical protein